MALSHSSDPPNAQLDGPLSKRRKVNTDTDPLPVSEPETSISTKLRSSPFQHESTGNDVKLRPISPPPRKIKAARLHREESGEASPALLPTRYVPSPIQLTRIRDLPLSLNVDTVSLHDILGDPLIKEVWSFNYLHDIDFTRAHLDVDVRESIRLYVIHGSWKREDPRRLELEAAAKRCSNVQLITAHMPEMFGTHHSKMLILLRHDETAQVVIHTANMISQDWTNLCQAIWSSPLLPLRQQTESRKESVVVGSGARFKCDLLRYLKAYDGKLKALSEQLENYDFSAVRAALVMSVPRKQNSTLLSKEATAWGWPGLRQVLRKVPGYLYAESAPKINMQISSVATLSEKWMDNLREALSASTLVDEIALSTSRPAVAIKQSKAWTTTFSVIFPTNEEVRRSLDGYNAGASIHMKIQNAAQQKQLSMLRPLLCHWAGDGAQRSSPIAKADTGHAVTGAGRRRAAPHIKTYIKFSDQKCQTIDWAMVTSANLSKQAWGEVANKDGDVRVQSYEIGVLVWPELFKRDEQERIAMVPMFRKDVPGDPEVTELNVVGTTVVGFRMPYDLPLTSYGKEDMPWCATASYTEPDWKGQVYDGHIFSS